MLGTIIRKEIVESISSMKFLVTFVVVTMLVMTGLIIGAKDYLEKKADADSQPLRNQEMLSAQDSWLTAGYIGMFESKRPYVLSIIDHGIDNSLGRSAAISMGLDARLDESRNLVSPILAVFGEVDLTFVVKIILSLFVILLTYDAISGEKERGTLKLTLSNEVSRNTFILGKIIGGYVVILISYVVPMLLGLVMMLGFYNDVMVDFDGNAWIRFGLINAFYFLYLALFFAVGLFVSSMTKKSSTSFIFLLMVWVLFVTIIPRVSLTVAERSLPYDSYATLQTKANREVAENRNTTLEKYQDQQVWMKAYQEDRLAMVFAEMFEKQTEMQQEITEKYNEQHRRQQIAQMNMAESLSRLLSPTSALTFAVQNLSGTGYERQQDYIDQLRKYQDGWRKFIINQYNKKMSAEEFQQMFSNETLDVKLSDVNFQYTEESLSTVVSRIMSDMLVLALMTLLFFVLAYVMFIRYDVR
jgi:ABC-type transport system involved in multi-copper enzyme maturation permease subunit